MTWSESIRSATSSMRTSGRSSSCNTWVATTGMVGRSSIFSTSCSALAIIVALSMLQTFPLFFIGKAAGEMNRFKLVVDPVQGLGLTDKEVAVWLQVVEEVLDDLGL